MKITYPLTEAHALSIEEVQQMLQTNGQTGLGNAEAESRSKEYGLNVYTSKKQKSLWLVLLHQFQSPIVYLLIFGASVSLYFKDVIEAIAIAVVILINALIGFFMEWQARSSMNALKEMDVVLSKVIRDGKTVEVPSEKLTPGDIILIEAGDLIPGDGRLIAANQLQCDESSLTGESLPTEKNTAAIAKEAALADQLNMVFKGTSVMNGNGKAVITGIAENTQLGTITSLVDSAEDSATPLDKKLDALSKNLIWLTLGLTAVFAITGIIEGKEWVQIIETSIALAVAAFPEGLPIVSTVALAYGVLLMAKRNVIVKKLASVETLGSTTVILTDKTGTLTENKVYVDTLSFPAEQVQVAIENNSLQFRNKPVEESRENFDKITLIGLLCNNATVKPSEEKKKSLGDPMEIALIEFGNASGLPVESIAATYQRVTETPFNSETKIMGTVNKSPDGYFVAAKGSVEQLLEKCSLLQSGASEQQLTDDERKKVLSGAETMAAQGLRVLAFAYKEQKDQGDEDYLKDLVYAGTIGFLDPPRLDIKDAIASCRKAGIKVVMITGDHPMTASNIAKKIGLVDEGEQQAITGSDMPDMDSLTDEWKTKMLSTAVFARTTPKQKLEIADVYQKAGNIVAMTGDGVNDAPALKKADVGIAMGLRGTQVAKETASIVLKDDSFISIAEAVAHGREIFQNIQKFVVYLVSCNLSEIFVITVMGFLAPESILIPLQILFLNMITDIFPALALGVGKGDQTVMLNPPRDVSKPILTKSDWISIVSYSALITVAVMAALFYCKEVYAANNKMLNNAAFVTLVFAQLFHVFNMTSPKAKLLVNEVTKNGFVWGALVICTLILILVYVIPQTRSVLGLVELPVNMWIVSIAAGLLPLVVIRLYKVIRQITGSNTNKTDNP